MRALPRRDREQVVAAVDAAIGIVRIDDDSEVGVAEFIERRHGRHIVPGESAGARVLGISRPGDHCAAGRH